MASATGWRSSAGQVFFVGPSEILCAIDTPWCSVLLRGSILVPHERIVFTGPAGERAVGPRYGTFVCYLGSRHLRFGRIFGGRGTILRPATVPTMNEGNTYSAQE